MRFSNILVAAAALVAGVAAQTKVEFTNSVFGTLIAGQPFDITWADAQGPVTITLKSGPTTNLQTVATIATGLTGTSFTWTPSTSIPSGTYALEITDGVTSNFGPQFVLGGGAVSASASASGSTGTATATGSSSSLPTISSSASSASTQTQSTVSTSSTASTHSSSASASSNSSSSASVASKTSSSSASSTSSTPTSTTHPPDSGAAGLASPLAFVLLAVAALITLN